MSRNKVETIEHEDGSRTEKVSEVTQGFWGPKETVVSETHYVTTKEESLSAEEVGVGAGLVGAACLLIVGL